MILSSAIRSLRPQDTVKPTWTRPELVGGFPLPTLSGQVVTPETSKRIASVYRCANTISDDIAMIPMQQLVSRKPGEVDRIYPDGLRRNMAYLVEVQPNPYQIPFILKKTAIMWLLFWGDAYLWFRPRTSELYVLPSDVTHPDIKKDGSLVYHTIFADGSEDDIPDVEVLHLMINSVNGINGKSVLTYARETIGRRQAASQTQAGIYEKGLMPGAIATMKGRVGKDARAKVRESYWESAAGANNAGGVVVLDDEVAKFEMVQIKPVDAQFLESISATDVDIANFFKFPLYKLNQGKESYEANSQHDEDYMKSTLDPYLVQWEQGAKIRWLPLRDQSFSYWKFNRAAFLRMNAKERSAYQKEKIMSGQYTPNQALAIDDMPSYEGGDYHYIPSNMAIILPDGSVQVLAKPEQGQGDQQGGKE